MTGTVINDKSDYISGTPSVGSVLIASRVLAVPTHQIDFDLSSLQAYRDLKIFIGARYVNGAGAGNLLMRFNNDAGASYDYQGAAAQTALKIGRLNDVTADSQFNYAEVLIPNYSNPGERLGFLGKFGGYVNADGGVIFSVSAGRYYGAFVNLTTLNIVSDATHDMDIGTSVVVHGIPG